MTLTPDQIKARRKALGLSMDRLAALSGVNWSTLQRIEAGTRKAHAATLRVIELALEKAAHNPPLRPLREKNAKPHSAPPAAKSPPEDTNDYADLAWRWMSSEGVNSSYSQFQDFANHSLEFLADDCIQTWGDKFDRASLIKALAEYQDKLAGQ